MTDHLADAGKKACRLCLFWSSLADDPKRGKCQSTLQWRRTFTEADYGETCKHWKPKPEGLE